MDDATVLLDALEAEFGNVDDEIVGSYERVTGDSGEKGEPGDELVACDGSLRIRVQIVQDDNLHRSLAHCHIIAKLGRDESEHLDACVLGINTNRKLALEDAAQIWTGAVAPCLFSAVHAKPVMGAEHFDGNEVHGVEGCHGFVGPMASRFVKDGFDLGDKARLFEFAGAMAEPGPVHLAKVTLDASSAGWKRTTEVNGHQATHADRPKCGKDPDAVFPTAPSVGLTIQFALFFQSPEAQQERANLDQAIRDFTLAFAEYEHSDPAVELLEQKGVDQATINAIRTFAPLAATRIIFEDEGCQFSPQYVEVHAGGATIERSLMSEVAYARTRAISKELFADDRGEKAFLSMATRSAEFDGINAALHNGSQLKDLRLTPYIVPVGEPTPDEIQAALQKLQAKISAEVARKKNRWWKFWR